MPQSRRLARSIFALAALLPVTRVARAQDQTLLRGGPSSLGVYAAPVLGITASDGHGNLLGGFRAGLLLGRRFGVGVAAYGCRCGRGGDLPRFGGPQPLATSGTAPDGPMRDRMGRDGGRGDGLRYGGLELEYLWQPSTLVHASVSTLVGGGTAPDVGVPLALGAPETMGLYDARPDRGPRTFFVAQPTGHVEVNVVQRVRLALGVGYRFTAGGSTPATGRGLSGAVGTFGLKFGKL